MSSAPCCGSCTPSTAWSRMPPLPLQGVALYGAGGVGLLEAGSAPSPARRRSPAEHVESGNETAILSSLPLPPRASARARTKWPRLAIAAPRTGELHVLLLNPSRATPPRAVPIQQRAASPPRPGNPNAPSGGRSRPQVEGDRRSVRRGWSDAADQALATRMQQGPRPPAWPAERETAHPVRRQMLGPVQPDRTPLFRRGVALLCEVKPSEWNTRFGRHGSPTSSASLPSSPRPLRRASHRPRTCSGSLSTFHRRA